MNIAFTYDVYGQPLPLKINLHAIMIYQKTFKRNFKRSLEEIGNIKKLHISTPEGKMAAQMIWAFAKAAQPKIPKFNQWKKQFISFPLNRIFVEINNHFVKKVE